MSIGLFRKFLSDRSVEKRYVSSGQDFGDAVGYLFVGEAIGFESMLKRWEKWEGEYSLRGFRTVSLDRFIDFGVYGRTIDDIIGKRRDSDEEPIFHAKRYHERFLGNEEPIIDLEKIFKTRSVQSGSYTLPSFE